MSFFIPELNVSNSTLYIACTANRHKVEIKMMSIIDGWSKYSEVSDYFGNPSVAMMLMMMMMVMVMTMTTTMMMMMINLTETGCEVVD
jgi:hypothetical protein